MSGTIFANQRASCGDLDDAERGDSSGGQQANGHVQGTVGAEGTQGPCIEFRPESAVDDVDAVHCIDASDGPSGARGPHIVFRQESAVDAVDVPDGPTGTQCPGILLLTENAVSSAGGPSGAALNSPDCKTPSSLNNAVPGEFPVEEPELKYSAFMPFKHTMFKHFPCQAVSEFKEWTQEELFSLLTKSFDNQESWITAAKRLVWKSDKTPEGVSMEFELEHIALCLKKAVWEEYKVENNAPGRRGLFWVLDPFKRCKQESKPISLNIFSFRALFGAVLCTHGKEAALQLEHGRYPIHVAAEKLLPDAVSYLLNWEAYANMQNLVNQPTLVNQQSLYAKRTALHYAVRFWQQNEVKQKQQKTLVQVLKAFKADHKVQDSRGHVPLFNAILTEDIDLIELLIEDSPINHADVDGDTHLHIAVDSQCAKVIKLLIENGADPLLRNHDGQTPSHIAAQRLLSCLKAMDETCSRMGIELVSTFSKEDMSGNTPLDYAAIHNQKSTFHFMWNSIQREIPLSSASYRPVLDRLYGHKSDPKIRLTTLQRTLEYLSKPMVQAVLTRKDSGDSDQGYQQASLYHLLESDEDDCSQAVTTVLDKCLYGENVVISNVLESDAEGIFPAKPENDVVIRQFVSSHEAIWGHPAMRIWIDHKWKTFGIWVASIFAFLYFLQMLALTTALSLAIRPGVTDETLNQYNTPLDQFRGFVEGVVILTWMVKIVNELHKLYALRPKIYFMQFFVYINISAIALLAITIVLRGTQSKAQWLFAALAYVMYSMLALEYLSLAMWSSAYIQTLFRIVKDDLTKFMAVFLVFLVGFAGGFLLVLQMDRASIGIVEKEGGMASASGDGSENSTVYAWNTFYLGIRTLTEAGSILEYNGNLGWLAVIFYLGFLMVTVIIMLNVLIAQMSDTYTTVKANAKALSVFYRARFLLRYYRWRKKDEDTIIWSGQGICTENADGCFCRAFGAIKKFAKPLFMGEQIAMKESTANDSKQEAMTTHYMHTMMERLKVTIRRDLKDLKHRIKEVTK